MNPAHDPRRTHTEVLAELVELDGRVVVDVGCGSGALVRWLHDQAKEAIGVECGEIMLALALEADPQHRGAYRTGVAQALPLPDASADVVIFSQSLHHVPGDDMLPALAEAHRVLRDGGVLYVVEPEAVGPGHEVIKVIDDETAVRALAQGALDQAPQLGFDPASATEFTSRTVVRDVDALAERVVGVDPNRAARMEQYRAEFERRFEQFATPFGDGFAFDQENIVRVFRKA